MEVWKDIPGYEGIYQASTLGRIRTCEGKTTNNKRYKTRRWKSRILKGRGDCPRTGKRVNLWKDSKPKDYLVARLVAATFLGPPEEGYTVNHIDGNRMNNAIENLEWLTLADNIRHGFKTGLYPTAKPIIVVKDGEPMQFESMRKCDLYLGRRMGYTSSCIANHSTITDRYGNHYEAKLL